MKYACINAQGTCYSIELMCRVLDVSLFGAPFRAPEGPFRLASLSGAQVLPVFARRNGFFDYALRVSEPVALGRRPSPEALQAGAQQAVSAMQA